MSENYQRNSTEGTDDLFSYFITSELPVQHIRNRLSVQGKSSEEIESVVEAVTAAREKINSNVKKFIKKLEKHYIDLDVPELIKKGLKHAKKHGLTDHEKRVFLRRIRTGDVHQEYSYLKDMKYTEMAKFLGYSDIQQTVLQIHTKDLSKLEELKALYDAHYMLHNDVKRNMFDYRDCAPEALNGTFDREKHNLNVSIHPLIAALFFPKVDYIEKRMLYTNFARLVLSRGQAYLGASDFFKKATAAPGEIDAELELANDIAKDPNSLDHFQNASPIQNIIKRFACQVELYKTVLKLRTGQYYAPLNNRGSDDISGFIRVINELDWTFFDSPDLYHAQDEGTVLRKLLAIFSIRPTWTQLTSYTQKHGLTTSSITDLTKTKLVNIPVVNLKLPLDLSGNSGPQRISLVKSLYQSDQFIEDGMIVPKNKSVIYSNQVCFFYANRRYQARQFESLESTLAMRTVVIPTPVLNTTKTNTTHINFGDRIRIGRDWFEVRSVVLLQRPPLNGFDIPTGSAAAIRCKDETTGEVSYFHYNPSGASVQYLSGNQYVSNDPVTYIPEYDTSVNGMGFRSEAQSRGIIFFYCKL